MEIPNINWDDKEDLYTDSSILRKNKVVADDMNQLKNSLNGAVYLLNALFPVGALYFNTTGTNPGTFLGGTWAEYAPGRVLVGQDTNDTDFDTLGETGGEKKHTLTKGELPHERLSVFKAGSTSGDDIVDVSTSSYVSALSSISTRMGMTDYMGDGNAHNNLQPYIVVSIWVKLSLTDNDTEALANYQNQNRNTNNTRKVVEDNNEEEITPIDETIGGKDKK